MARITLENIHKTFGKVRALDGVSLDVKDKEFFVLFGPAGAGKTTILNCIAGIAMPEEGIVKFDGEVMNLVDTANRNVAMVFENYALYPQMTVYDNMASPLRSKLYRESEDVIKERVNAAAKMMKMENLLDRLPSQLSNGQKQRVAMGRALVRTPNVFLMDEPLAHLDAKLRNAMRTELKEMQANFGTTSIYVTHDFMEAMSLGDRIAIINQGRIVQIGTPDDIYYLPHNEFVAQLMGDPEINLLSGSLRREGNAFVFVAETGTEFALPEDGPLMEKLAAYTLTGTGDGKAVDMGIRPQHVRYSFEEKDGYRACQVYSYESIGNKSVIEAYRGKIQVRMIAPNGLTVKIDQPIYIDFLLDQTLFFDGGSKNFIGRYNEAAIRALSSGEAAFPARTEGA
ncbi:MAG: ABC transporter ATP-binding protein [Synergistaceae bacterium]|nr:ABC transporter ATP-binding protein [Synergistaceae bacterium]